MQSSRLHRVMHLRNRAALALKRIKVALQSLLAHALVLGLATVGVFFTGGAAASTVYMSATGVVFPTMAACVQWNDGPPPGMGLGADGWTHDGAPFVNNNDMVEQLYWVPGWEVGFNTPYSPSPYGESCGSPATGNCPPGSEDNGTGSCVTVCEAGQARNQVAGSRTQGQCIATVAPSNLGRVCPGKGCPVTADPVNTGTGNKFQIEVDFLGTSTSPLTFSRTYNSNTGVVTTLGVGWQHEYERFITVL
ncbi:MAG: DUF6531 domain-containing protein, partial [Thiobacillaceae bacterium]